MRPAYILLSWIAAGYVVMLAVIYLQSRRNVRLQGIVDRYRNACGQLRRFVPPSEADGRSISAWIEINGEGAVAGGPLPIEDLRSCLQAGRTAP